MPLPAARDFTLKDESKMNDCINGLGLNNYFHRFEMWPFGLNRYTEILNTMQPPCGDLFPALDSTLLKF